MTTDVLVIGGGPAGCAAAIQLARAGVEVTLLERETLPAHKVCGEFLSGEALLFLSRLGIDLPSIGALPLQTVRLAGSARLAECPLPFPARSLTRRTLDPTLLQRAQDAGARVRRGCTVEHLAHEGGRWRARLRDGNSISAGSVFLASGKHDLRGHPRPRGRQHGMVAFKMYWRLSAAEMQSLGSAVELLPYRGGYAGLQPVEGGLVNLCCLVHADELRRVGGTWPGFLAHICGESSHLRQRLALAEPQLEKPLTIASLPYGFVRKTSEGPWYLGDQALVIPSFTGDGMSLALHTGLLAAKMYLRNESAIQYQQTVAMHVSRQVSLATAFSKTLVRFPGLAMPVLRLWPGAMERIAQWTRLDPAYRAE